MAGSGTIAPAIVGRDPELAAIADFVEGLRSGPHVLLLEGAAGIGKTVLWRAALDAARDRSYRVLHCRPSELESRLTFGGLIDLFAEVPDETIALLPEPQRDALGFALLRREAGAAGHLQRQAAVAALGVIRILAASGPVLIAVDDLPWLDAASSTLLAYVVRRLEREPVGVVATIRDGARPRVALDRSRTETELTRLTVPPLTAEALRDLVRDRTGIMPPRAALTSLMRSSGGNPFFALEIVRAVGREGSDLASAALPPVPRGLRELVADRLAVIPVAAREAVLATFALAHPTPAAIEAALAAARRSPRGLAIAVDAEALEIRHGGVELRHPLIGSVLYGDLGDAERRALHSRLARIADHTEERARHLALAALPMRPRSSSSSPSQRHRRRTTTRGTVVSSRSRRTSTSRATRTRRAPAGAISRTAPRRVRSARERSGASPSSSRPASR